jgi:hypothetical protein
MKITAASNKVKYVNTCNRFRYSTYAFLYMQPQGVSKNVPVSLQGTRFEASNHISERGPQEHYRDIF